MGDNIWLEDRHGVRTPMQWSRDGPHGGFSPAATIYSPMVNDAVFGYQTVNVENVVKDPSSIYHIVCIVTWSLWFSNTHTQIRTMLQRRRKHLAFGHGDFKWVKSSTPALACYLRQYGIDRMLIVHNLSNHHVVRFKFFYSILHFASNLFLVWCCTSTWKWVQGWRNWEQRPRYIWYINRVA